VSIGAIASGEPLPIPVQDRPRNLVDLVHRSVLRWPAKEALRWKVLPAGASGGSATWSSWTFAQLWDEVRALSLGLQRLGLSSGDRVAILSRSRPEWIVADLASLALGAVTCPIQPGEPAGRLAAMLRHLAPRVVVVENDHLLQRLLRATGGGIPATIVTIERDEHGPDARTSLADVAASADRSTEATATWAEAIARIPPSQLATVVHTMGEDGQERGAVLTHGNVVHSALAAPRAVPLSTSDVMLSVLPLSHMFERGANVLASLGVGTTVVFADRSMERWAGDLAEVQPTVMCCVPLFFELLERRIRGQVAAGPAYARLLFGWATRVGARMDARREAGRGVPPHLRLAAAFARRTVLARVHRALGGRLRFFISGGAPLPEATGRFFASLGVAILEGFGLTETAPLLTVNRPGSQRYGTVGPPVHETEVRIAPQTGEVLVRGPQVMSGYLDLPEVNRKLVDADGWFHTGDIGSLDADGYLRIIGRIKNLIVLATGKKVAAAAIERALATSPLIGQAVLLGDRQDALGLLVVPSDAGLADPTRLHREVERLTSEFAAHERPRRLALLPRTLSADSGEIDGDGRPVRDAIVAHFPDEVAALFRTPQSRPEPISAGPPAA
jgi:long-chain acyl-CoA synthetase